jgi:hypothetical protein
MRAAFGNLPQPQPMENTMVWRCSFGVPNCPICPRPLTEAEKEAIRAKNEKARAKRVIERAIAKLVNGQAKVSTNFKGQTVITGLTDAEREGATDQDIIFGVMGSTHVLAKSKLPAAVQQQARFVCN